MHAQHSAQLFRDEKPRFACLDGHTATVKRVQEPVLPGDSSIQRARIFAVIVLYKQRPSASVTVATLAVALREAPVDCAVLVYDNSPDNGTDNSDTAGTGSSSEALPASFRYHAAPSNRGLLGAYEAALNARGPRAMTGC